MASQLRRASSITVLFETHATSLDNEAALASGHFDVPLSAAGEKQARELGERYRGRHIDVVFCSDLQRSYRTAELAFDARDTTIARDPRLRECDYGALTRRPRQEVHSQPIERLEKPFPAGESYRQAADRMKEFLSQVAVDFEGKVILIIGHRATQCALEHWLHRRPLEEVLTSHWQWQPGWTYEFDPSRPLGPDFVERFKPMPTALLPRLRLFVYGTLKPGFSNHGRYCRGVCSMEEARIEGRLSQMPTGYPVLRVRENLILARATGNLVADVGTEQRLAKERATWGKSPSRSTPTKTGLPKDNGPTTSRVHGTILTFADPVDRLRAMDDLEQFRPGRRNRYERVLVPVYSRICQATRPAWIYIAGDLSPQGRLNPTGRWIGRSSS